MLRDTDRQTDQTSHPSEVATKDKEGPRNRHPLEETKEETQQPSATWVLDWILGPGKRRQWEHWQNSNKVCSSFDSASAKLISWSY